MCMYTAESTCVPSLVLRSHELRASKIDSVNVKKLRKTQIRGAVPGDPLSEGRQRLDSLRAIKCSGGCMMICSFIHDLVGQRSAKSAKNGASEPHRETQCDGRGSSSSSTKNCPRPTTASPKFHKSTSPVFDTPRP